MNTKCALIFGILFTLLLDPISGKRGFSGGHNYPKSGGLSGGGHRGGGLSGGGHGYPSSGGSHAYPSSGGSHAYPSSGGSHAYPSSGGNHAYPSSGGSHGYPSSGGKSGSGSNHGYPASTGLSGGGGGYPANKPAVHQTHTTHVHNNYHYTPPQQISYAPVRGAAPVSYPVYHGTPPTYVYKYKDSGSKYGTLLAGLALMNLGTLGVAAYAAHRANQNQGPGSYTYTPQKGEVCKFAIKKDNGDYEETRIDCQIISGFILQDMQEQKALNHSIVTTTTTVTNVTIVNSTNVNGDQTTTAAPVLGNVMYVMLPNGTLVPVNVTGIQIPGLPGVQNAPENVTEHAQNTSSSVVTTTTNTTVVSALDVKGKPVEVTPGMQCFVIRHSPTSNMRKSVPCGLLQTYADKSLRRSSATRNMPMFTIVAVALAYCFS